MAYCVLQVTYSNICMETLRLLIVHVYNNSKLLQLTTRGTSVNINIPVTSSVISSLAITDGLALITPSHWITLPSSVVLNCEIV